MENRLFNKGYWENWLSVGKIDDGETDRQMIHRQDTYRFLFHSTHKNNFSALKSECKIKDCQATRRKYKRIITTWR